MIDRRKKECCIYCGGEEMRWQSGDKIIKICLICGKDFEAKRSGDMGEFHKVAEDYN